MLTSALRGECETPVQYLEFKEWVAKEWAVHCAHIKWMQGEIEKCYNKHGLQAPDHCGALIKEYMDVVSEENLREAKK